MRKQLLAIGMASAFAGIVGLAAACGGSSSGDDDDDIILPDGGGSGGDGGGSGIDAATQGDGNDSFDQAQVVTIDDPLGVNGAIQTPLDRDYYKFDATAGDWLNIHTVANAMDDPMKVDTVITLYDASMTQVAENDDAVPRINTDSEIIIRAPATGTYYVEVLEWSDWANDTPEGDPSFTYQLLVEAVDPSATGVVQDPESGDDAASATALEFASGGGLVIGDFNDATDVDVYSLAIGTAPGPVMFSSAIAPDGPDGYGSTAPAGQIYVTNAAGTQILARIDATQGSFELSPPVAASSNYLVWITRPAGATAGSNDFYAFKFATYTDNPAEAESSPGANDSTGTAEALTDMSGSSFILAHLDADTDVDYFSFSATSGQTISAACGGASLGSGVVGLRAQLRDASDAVIGGQDEDLTTGIFIDSVSAANTGTYYLRLSKTGQDPQVSGNFVRCGVHVQ